MWNYFKRFDRLKLTYLIFQSQFGSVKNIYAICHLNYLPCFPVDFTDIVATKNLLLAISRADQPLLRRVSWATAVFKHLMRNAIESLLLWSNWLSCSLTRSAKMARHDSLLMSTCDSRYGLEASITPISLNSGTFSSSCATLWSIPVISCNNILSFSCNEKNNPSIYYFWDWNHHTF